MESQAKPKTSKVSLFLLLSVKTQQIPYHQLTLEASQIATPYKFWDEIKKKKKKGLQSKNTFFCPHNLKGTLM